MITIWGTDKRRPRHRGHGGIPKRARLAEETSSEWEEANDDDDGDENPTDQALATILEEDVSGDETLAESEAREDLIAGKDARDRLRDKKNGRKSKRTPGQVHPPPGPGEHLRGTFDVKEVKRHTRYHNCQEKGHEHKECLEPRKDKDRDKKHKSGGGDGSSSGSGFFAFTEE